MIRLTDKQKIKLKNFYLNKEYNLFEKEVENLGQFDELPEFLKAGYANSKILNPNSKNKDYILATFILEKIFKQNKNQEILNNLIVAGIKAEAFSIILPHLNEEYQYRKNDKILLEGLARVHFGLCNMDLSVKFFNQLLNLHEEKIVDGGRLSYLASLNYVWGVNQKDYLIECKKLQISFQKNFVFSDFKKNKNIDKKIKIGFLSGDLRNHSVGHFLNGFLKKIDKEKFNITAFSNLEISRHDSNTEYFKKIFDNWHDVLDYSDHKLIDFTRSLNLDILIDLSGFTYGNRINVLAARCAPIQILWLGYNNSTGLNNVDYLISDPNLIKENEKDQYSEKILFMPNVWNAMTKPDELPEIEELPFKNNLIFTFGSFNSFRKISNRTIKVWAQILKNTNTRLILKNSSGYNIDIYNNILDKFRTEGVNTNQVILIKRKKNFFDHLKDYNQIDLALDTFPYTGVTTSFQSNLMGVPVLTLKGFNFNSRCGESINKNLQLENFIAVDENDYIAKALSYLNKIEKLAEVRKSLRQKTLDSPLFDMTGFVKDFANIVTNLTKI